MSKPNFVVRYNRVNRQEAAIQLYDQFVKAGFEGRVTLKADETETVAFYVEGDPSRDLVVSWSEAVQMLREDDTRIPVGLKVLPHGEGLPLPSYESAGAAGMDLRAAVPAESVVSIAPGEIKLVPTGLSIALPEGAELQVRPRSGLAAKHGVTVLNSPGTVDSDYRGEIKAILINHGQEPFLIQRGDRIAQAVIAPVAQARWVLRESLDETTRGEGGFGSTGRN